MKRKLTIVSVLTLIILSIGAVFSLGSFSFNKNNQSSNEVENVKSIKENVKNSTENSKLANSINLADTNLDENLENSNWLVYRQGEEILPYKDEVIAGQTSGYGKFVLNAKDVSLSTTANTGFELVGWNFTYFSGEETNKFLYLFSEEENLTKTSNSFVYTLPSETVEGQAVTIKAEYFDLDNDNFFDSGTFNISNVFSDMTVEPVFDYIYYNLDVSSAFGLTDVAASLSESSSYKTLQVNGSTLFYLQEDDGIYSYAFLQTGEQVLFCNQVKLVADELFTTRTQNGVEQNISLSRGTFRFNENVNLTLNINAKEILAEGGINIDVTQVKLIENGSTSILTDDKQNLNWAEINKEDNGRTTSVQICINILNTKNRTSFISLDYDNLFVASISPIVDNLNTGSENDYIKNSLNIIKQSLQINYYFSQIDEATYFVKNSLQNEDNRIFELLCQTEICGENSNYVYYTFNSITLSENIENQHLIINGNILKFADINQNFEIFVDYSSFEYNITFAPYLQIENKGEQTLIRINEPNFNINAPKHFVRGSSYACNSQINAENVGYEFLGYSLNSQPEMELEVTIDEIQPQDLEVKMIYKYVSYSMQLTNYDSIYLDNGINRIMPISVLNISIDDNITDLSSTLRTDNENKYQTKSLIMATNLIVGNSVSVTIAVNNGFILKSIYILEQDGYFVENLTEQTELTFKFSITQDFISFLTTNSLLNDKLIKINVTEDFVRYSFTYYIEPTFDAAQQKDVIMAEIDATTENEQAKFSYFYDKDETEYSTKQEKADLCKIVIANLKLYDAITLSAKGKSYNDTTYQYVRFTEKNITSLKDSFDGTTATATRIIDKNNISIKVIYSSSKTRFTITTNMPNAFGLENEQIKFSNYLEIYQNIASERTKIDIDGNNDVVIQSGQFSINFLPNMQFNFGYRFKNYLLIVDGITQETRAVTGSTYPYLETFSISVKDSSVCELNLEFELINFRLIVNQYGEGYVNNLGNAEIKTFNGEKYSFDGNLYLDINVENNGIKIVLPEGSYISRFYFIEGDSEIEFDNLGQSNASTDFEFNHKFSISEIQKYFLIYGSYLGDFYQIDLNLEYVLHTYSIVANYKFYQPKGELLDNQISYPSLLLTYNFKGENRQIITEPNNKSYTFNNLPYGVKVRISLQANLPIGYTSFDAWGSDLVMGDNIGNSNGLDWIEISKLTSNRNLVYLIDYQTFLIEIVDSSNFYRGDALVEVKLNGAYNSYKRVEMYDAFKITFIANRSIGFKFNYMYYFVPYTLGQEGYQENQDNIYIYSNGFKKAEGYNAGETYYLRKFYSENIVFEEPNLNINDYAIINNKIYFYAEFDYIKINLINQTEDLNLSLTTAGVEHENYSTYKVYKKVGGNFVNINELEDKTLIATDVVRIEISINSVEIKNIRDLGTKLIDLSDGLSLFQISYISNFKTISKGKYEIEFNVQSLVEQIDDADNLTLTYFYKIENRQVELTTNIKSQKFYKNFIMSYNGLNNFKEFNNTTSESVLISNLQFLAEAEFTYSFNGIDSSLFNIQNVKFYKIGGRHELILPNEYDNYGIEIGYGDKIMLSVRYLNNLRIELQVEPNLIFNKVGDITKIEQDENNDYWFYKVFECDNTGAGIEKEQILTLGETRSYNIQAAKLILDCIQIKYLDNDGIYVNPTIVGQYSVEITFNAQSESDYDWINEIILSYNIYLVITPKPLDLINGSFNITKVYDGSASIDFGQISNYLTFTDGNNVFIPYADSLFKFAETPTCVITITNSLGQEELHADVGLRLNILISKIQLTNSGFNKNFSLNLTNGNYVMIGVVTISQRSLYLVSTGDADVYDKVYDGTTLVDYDTSNFVLGRGLIESDRQYVSIDFSNLTFAFENAEVGKNKRIVPNSNGAIKDVYSNIHKAQNYKLELSNYTASIYPSSVSAYVAGIGEITIYNQLGKINTADSEHSYRNFVKLIPIGAELEIKPIFADSLEYRQIYSLISSHLSNLTVFAFGYQIGFNVNGEISGLNNNLVLSMPTISRLNQALWLSQTESGKLEYTTSNGIVYINLNQISGEFNGFVFTKSRRLLTWWQITLIVILILIIIILLILLYIHFRRQKHKRDALNERI